jgi:hypothetical protein
VAGVLEIKLSGSMNGEEIRPETFGISELIHLLNGVLAAVKAETPGGQFTEQVKPRLLALKAIRPGSNILEIEYASEAAEAVDRITSALVDRNLGRLTKPGQQGIRDAFKRLIKGGGGVQILNGRATPVFTQANPIPAPSPPRTVRETASLLVYVKRVGGERRPTIGAKFYATGQELTVRCSRSLVKRLSDEGCLFEDVSLEGEAVWRVEPWQLLHFKASDFIHHKRKSASHRFDELADKLSPVWRKIDPDEYMAGARGGDPE